MNTPESLWHTVDNYFSLRTLSQDPVLEEVLAYSRDAGIPDYHIAANQAAFLQILVSATGSRRVLEIGTLAGYSAIWLARGVARDGYVTTLELNPSYVEVARSNVERAGFQDRVEIICGPAEDSICRLQDDRTFFDFVFIDADKQSNRRYFELSLEMSRPGALIVVDNVVRNGAVTEPGNDDPRVQGVHELMEAVAHEPRVEATVIQTVGAKGYDGFLIARRRE